VIILVPFQLTREYTVVVENLIFTLDRCFHKYECINLAYNSNEYFIQLEEIFIIVSKWTLWGNTIIMEIYSEK